MMETTKNENTSETPEKVDSLNKETNPQAPVSGENESDENADKQIEPEIEEKQEEQVVAKEEVEEPKKVELEEEKASETKEEKVETKEEVKSLETSVEEKTEAPETSSVSNKEVAEKEEAKEAVEEKSVEKKTTEVAAEKPVVKKEPVDYAKLSKAEILAELEKLIKDEEIEEIKDNFEEIKAQFYKKHKQEQADKKKQFIDKGGNPDEFVPEDDELEKNFKAYSNIFREKKAEFSRKMEEDKKLNLQLKYDIINEIKDLVNRKESINKTFQDFRELQKRWREVGLVPQSELKNLWETYHHHVETFYDYIKINKELRDLDLKKNLENKIELCEKAESLLLESNTPKAFAELQLLHDKWREIGPVPRDKKEELWLRFKEATAKINKKHQEYYQFLKDEQIQNLKQKEALCEKVEEINKLNLKRHKKWEEKSKEIIEMQKMWKSIGFAPRKDNHKIYKRFKEACDEFFDKKRGFFEGLKEEQENNLQIKLDLCVQAEALKDSTEWKKTTEDLINLQKKWKEIGPVPRRHSESIWKRFRTACDTFFNRKSEFFSKVDEEQEKNLELKLQLIERIEKFQPSDNDDENLKELKGFQKEWADIGHIPLKQKDEIQAKYRDTINSKFDSINIDESKRNMLKFKNKIEVLSNSTKSRGKINVERNKVISKIKELENEIALFENNKGFFAKSKNADELIADIDRKIEKAKEKIEQLNEKLQLIENIEDN